MKESTVPAGKIEKQDCTVLVGAGVVGRAILRSHLEAGLSVVLVDQDTKQLELAIDQTKDLEVSTESCFNASLAAESLGEIRHHHGGSQASDDSCEWINPSSGSKISSLGPHVRFHGARRSIDSSMNLIVLESISERLESKQAFFQKAESILGNQAIFYTNTSNLQIHQIAKGMKSPHRLCGMHFFMPVHSRHAVEVACGDRVERRVVERAVRHVKSLGKSPIIVGDSPGFIVNRLLAPYLNEAMMLLCRGVSPQKIERVAKRFGMPLSPLELMDWIGTRTVFDAGRVFWQSYPKRLHPAPLLPALIKQSRGGRFSGGGFYDYLDGSRSKQLSTVVSKLVQDYCTDRVDLSDRDVMHLLAVPMWIESALARLEGVVGSNADLDCAMRGGLGYAPGRSWTSFFDRLGSQEMVNAMNRWGSLTPAINAPFSIKNMLHRMSPSQVIGRDHHHESQVA
ncbi:3-hydroxyacyl-CoA dehydrogenase family protein [bacterium]|nr:3-hydroxyacyl-CoA dehydrogenase family protein [bacterium]